MRNFQFSIDKFLDHFGKIGVILITGGIAGSVFTNKVPALMGVYAVVFGLVFVILGSIESKPKEE